MSPKAKRLAFFIPLAASIPLWVGALPQSPVDGHVLPSRPRRADADLQAGQARIEDLPLYAAGGDGPDATGEGREHNPFFDKAIIVPLQAEAPAHSAPSPSAGVAVSPQAPPSPPARARSSASRGPASVRPVPRAAPRTRKIRMLVTGYCPCPACCGRHADNTTACGKSIYANHSRFVAADARLLDFGTRVSVPGYHSGAPVSVLDRGGRIKGRRLDVFFLSHGEAQRWGARWLDVTVYED